MKRHLRQHGVVSILAMMFIVIFSALAAAMAIVTQGNLRTAETYRRVNRSLSSAETGLSYFTHRLGDVAGTIKTSVGYVDENEADTLWPQLRDAMISELGLELHSLEGYTMPSSSRIEFGRIPVGDEPGAPTYQITIERHPLAGEDYDSDYYQRAPYSVGDGDNEFTTDGEAVSNSNPVASYWVRIQSTGVDGAYQRSVQMDFRIGKKIRFAILSRNRVMIGRNVLIEGTIGSKYTLTDFTHGHPVQIRDNFTGLDPTLDTWVSALQDYLADNDINGDNRVWLANPVEAGNLANAESYDRNADGYVDAYDMFLLKYDADSDGALTSSEFSEGGSLVDSQLWQLINEVKYPAGTQFDWANEQVKLPGGEWTDASDDMNSIDNSDAYAKIAGEIALTVPKSQWESEAAAGDYQKYLSGPIHPDPTESPLTFEASTELLAEYSPDDFDTTTYKVAASGNFANQVTAAIPNDTDTAASYTPPSTDTIESVPYNSPHPYDHYERPVYENYTFTNVTIPKGTNALFVNCKFVGVTFVESEVNNDDPNFNYAGIQNADGSQKYSNVVANVNGTDYADTKPLANNLRFHNCKFEGMIASDAVAGFTHARNKLQFTGLTSFDPNADSLSSTQKDLAKKSTIMTPQYSVDMGTFTEPNTAAEVLHLEGTLVAGVFDVRGQATIDGSIITTYEPVVGEGPLAEGGNPASFNTTIGYFESAAGDGEGEIPTGGYGKIIIRYDPSRAIPDGINGPIEVRAEADTYYEGG